MIHDVQFEEPANLHITPRQLIAREPGVLSQRLIRLGLVRTVTQAKIAIVFILVGSFLASTYFLEAALSGPDIPPRPPSLLESDIHKERLR